MNLKQKAVSGVKWNTLSQGFDSLIQLIQLIIVTNYLSPNDFGLMAIVLVVVGLSKLLIDMGISKAIIYKQDITSYQLSSLYWLNIFSGVILFFIASLSAPYVAGFYSEPGLKNLIYLGNISFLVIPAGQLYNFLLQKELKFRELSIFKILSRALSFTLTIVLAIMGFGVWSLIWGYLFFVILLTIFYIIIGLKYFKPSFYFRIKDIMPFLNFGMYQMGERFLNYFYSQFDAILIGKLIGTEALGNYDVAKRIILKPLQIINPIINKVTFPVLSKLQDDSKKIRDLYLKVINVLSSINFPIYFLLAILAEPIVVTLLGNRWLDAVIIVRILSFYALARSLMNPVGTLMLAKGKANVMFFWHLTLFIITPIFIYMGSFYNIEGVTTALLIMQIIIIPIHVPVLIGKVFKTPIILYAKSIIYSLIITIVSSMIVLVVYINIEGHVASLIVCSSLMALVYLLISYKFNKKAINEFNNFVLKK